MISPVCTLNTNHALRSQLQLQKYPNYDITYITKESKITPWLNLLNHRCTF
jgi:hypothetical protein